jgi:photosystem II stability/assembly factor-like uncharacterized protein
VSVTTRPRRPEIEQDRDLERRVADLEALIEEARGRARRRRRRNWGATLVVAAIGAAALFGFRGGGGGGAGTAALTDGPPARGQAGKPAQSLAALPDGNWAWAFAFDPRRPNVVYVASPHARGAFVYKTTDDGQHWHSTGARGTGWTSDILTLTADPRHAGTLYAGTDTAVYKTVDGGRSWQPFNRGLFSLTGCRNYRPVGAKPYCVNLGTPGTTSWNRNNGWVLDVSVDPIERNVVYAAAGAVRKSIDGGHTWKRVFQPSDGEVSRIAIAPTRPESIYAVAHDLRNGDTAIYKSTDAGGTWQATGGVGSLNLPPYCCADGTDALAVDSQNPQKLYAAVAGTVLATTDGGATWQPTANGLPANGATSLAADPRHAGTVYASVEISHTSKTKAGDVEKPTGAIYKTTDGGQTWSEVFSGFGIEKIAVDPTRPSTVFAAGWAGRDSTHPDAFRLLRTTDGGHTWVTAR